jgi:arsenate reductase
MPLRVLILCTGNSCRSQMAEGLFRLLGGDRVAASSAGVDPEGYVHPLAVRVMDELGIDMHTARSKAIEEFLESQFDIVITVCDHAAEHCPAFPGAPMRLHWPTEDPFNAAGDDESRMNAYRRVRDELRHRIEGFLAERGLLK